MADATLLVTFDLGNMEVLCLEESTRFPTLRKSVAHNSTQTIYMMPATPLPAHTPDNTIDDINHEQLDNHDKQS